MKASILINNYNYGRFLGECIESALAQRYPDMEVIVVDDGSTDGSREIIERFGRKITPVFKSNGGQASCFNRGFAAATGDVIFLLDADDAFLPGKVAHVIETYRSQAIGWCFDRVTHQMEQSPEERISVSLVDKRRDMKRGRFPTLPIPTSGLTFKRSLLSRILPMPTSDGIALSDNYLKFAAAHLDAGALISTPLTFQRLHGDNRYTGSPEARVVRSKIMVKTGHHLAKAFPDLRLLGMHLVAGGITERQAGPIEGWNELREPSSDGTFGLAGRQMLWGMFMGKKLKRVLAR